MEISYANSRIRKICTDEKVARKEIGIDGAKVLRNRLDQMRDAKNLGELRFVSGDWHELKGDREGQLACSLRGLDRLIFTPANDPRPTKPDGGLDWSEVTAVMNIKIDDYHST
jgi:proteic killer suppression protein